MNVTDGAGRTVSLGKRLGRGGEAEIFAVTTDPGRVAKVYYHPSAERAAKLHAMIGSPPSDPTTAQGHVSICWPTALLFDPSRVCAGFLMHRVDFSSTLPVFSLYNPQDRSQIATEFTWGYLLRTAINICSAIEAIHTKGYVIGDVNESNILVAGNALVTLVDCDSMQVPRLGTGMFYRCPVGKAEFTPPELQRCDFENVDRTSAHDNFGLGVLLFQLLMEGTHPFSGIWQGHGDPPPVEDRIRRGASPYATAQLVRPMPGAPPFSILPPPLQSLFTRCFCDGHLSPGSRPTPREWHDTLADLQASLRGCPSSQRHIYSAHLSSCPWCERTQSLGGLDPFPLTRQPRPMRSQRVVPRPGLQHVVVPVNPVVFVQPGPVSVAPPVSLHWSPRNVWLAVLVVGALLLFAILGLKSLGDARAAQAAAQAANLARQADLARQAEALRVAERARVEETIPGVWYKSNGSSGRPTALTIIRTGETFRAEYTSVIGLEVLRADLQPDNHLRLVNERQVGKLVNPFKYYRGDFAQFASVELSADGSFLIITQQGDAGPHEATTWKRGL